MTKFKFSGLSAALLAASLSASGAELDIQLQNLTQGIYFTPVLIVAHSDDVSLFEAGEMASAELQAMAEGGDIAPLGGVADSAGGDVVENPAEGLLMPATTTSASLTVSEGNTVLSLVAMLLPTNDGFVGLDNWPIPGEPGTYTLYLNGYDAGTEANDEIRGSGVPGEGGMPVPEPLEELVGTGGSGVTSTVTNATVHIHPGNLGDEDMEGGISDVSNQTQRWLNPVAKLTITVSE